MDITAAEHSLSNLSKFNVILGKNGCGKSTVLKNIEERLDKAAFGRVRYLSPERGGQLVYEASIEQAMSNPAWLADTRRQNQTGNFRQQSASLFRRLELLTLREIEKDQYVAGYVPRNFVDAISPISELLERVRIERDDEKPFKIIDRETGEETTPQAISSGESELISLGIECLAFRYQCDPEKDNILLIDEPDVHLHPDLQYRLTQFMRATFAESKVTVIVATHSTALLAGLAADADTRVAFMRRRDPELSFQTVSEVDRKILPIFGAHPLSNVFNQAPLLLVEGEDDERVWQQAVRSSGGAIRLHPCVVDGNSHFGEFEAEVNKLIGAVYDDAKAFSVRDRDAQPEAIEDEGFVIRMRLSCRAAENLMLSDDALRHAGVDWMAVQKGLEEWARSNGGHQYHAHVIRFRDEGFDRKGHDLKDIRNIVIGIFSNKPWEVLVGQAIADIARNGKRDGEHGLSQYLGEKTCANLLGI